MSSKFEGSGETELVTGTLRGYRCWNLIRDDNADSLWSVGNPMPWPGRTLSATCRSFTGHVHIHVRPVPVNCDFSTLADMTVQTHTWFDQETCTNVDCPDRPQPHLAPDRRCTCGVYGWYTPVWATLEHRGDVIGVTESDGNLVMGTSGFRAHRSTMVAVAPNPWRFGTFDPELGRWRINNGLDAMFFMARLQGTMKLHYPGVQIFEDAFALLKAFPPDLGTVRNLGVEPNTLPNLRRYVGISPAMLKAGQLTHDLALAGDPGLEPHLKKIHEDATAGARPQEMEKLEAMIKWKIRHLTTIMNRTSGFTNGSWW